MFAPASTISTRDPQTDGGCTIVAQLRHALQSRSGCLGYQQPTACTVAGTRWELICLPKVCVWDVDTCLLHMYAFMSDMRRRMSQNVNTLPELVTWYLNW